MKWSAVYCVVEVGEAKLTQDDVSFLNAPPVHYGTKIMTFSNVKPHLHRPSRPKMFNVLTDRC